MKERRKTALVTGGGKRIGRAIVEDLSAHGFGVAIHANRSSLTADQMAQDIRKKGGRAHVVRGDLRSLDTLGNLVEQAASQLGPLDLLVNNASIFERDEADHFQPALWNAHFDIHLKAPVILTQHFARQIADSDDNDKGLVVNIIDQRVWALTPHFFSYTLSKAALWTATQTMAQAFAPDIRVNAIGPGPTLANERQKPADFRRQSDAVLLRHGPELGEFGRTIRYLYETPSLTGQMIALDGGQHLAWETPDVANIPE